jgi:hypothetical protein
MQAPPPPPTSRATGFLQGAKASNTEHLAKEVRVLIGIALVIGLVIVIVAMVHAQQRISH